MSMEFKYKVKWCPVCSQGWVEIVKEFGTNVLFLCCSECETEWSDPAKINSDNGMQDNFGQIDVPSIEQIKAARWNKYLLSGEDI